MESKKINGIAFDYSDMIAWREQYSKEDFYARAKSIYWVEFDSDIQLRCIDEMWAMGEKEEKKPTAKK